MAESFENKAIADIMNAHFVNIKIDRENAPTSMRSYMIATQAMTGSGGWPMSVWLTPDLKPFYAGTYFPPDDRDGRAGFPSVLTQLAQAWNAKRDSVLRSAEQISELLKQHQRAEKPRKMTDPSVTCDAALNALTRQFDSKYGGFGPLRNFRCRSTWHSCSTFSAGRAPHPHWRWSRSR